MASIHLLRGEYGKTVELGRQQYPNLTETNFAWASYLATAFQKIGEEQKAREQLNHLTDLANSDTKALFFLAMNYSEMGRKDEALTILEKCLEMREERMNWIKDEPRLLNIKDEARFQAMLQKMNLPA
jgi:cytochrome c-type biogenesis protein CcmH/NrfG